MRNEMLWWLENNYGPQVNEQAKTWIQFLLDENARLRAQLAHAHALIGVMSDPTFEVQP